jgi:SRSO17 transposase
MTKNDHFLEMLDAAGEKGLRPRYVLIDSWYTSKKNLKAIEAKNWKFIADIKVNRKISEEKGVWISVSELELAEKQVKKVWLHEFGPVLIMKSTVKGEKEKYSITNDFSLIDWEDFSNTGKKRWAVEDMHRGLKQLCGLEKSYMRKARAQKNHIFCSMRAFVLLKITQTKLNISIYQQKWGIVRNSVRNFLTIRCFA